MSRRLLIVLALFALVVGVLSPTVAGAEEGEGAELVVSDKEVERSTTGSYIVVMSEEPLVVTEGQENLDTNAAQAKSEAIEETHDEVLEEAGVESDAKVQSFTIALNGFSAVMSHKQAESVAGVEGVALVLPDELQQLDTEASPKFLGLTGRNGAWAKGFTGEGVIVGVIDSGIWPEHPSFADDGTFPAAPPLDNSRPNCEFGNVAHNPDDAPFTCNDKLIGARQMLDTYRALIGADPDEFDSARDDDGHGTHTASTAAGNSGVAASMYGMPLGEISGIAPRAQVIAYTGLGNLGGFTSDLAAAIDQAVFDGVDVINYSVGGGAGVPGADEIAFLFANDAGVFVATSAGNSGPGASTLGNPGTMPWMTTVGASTQQRFFQGKLVLTHKHKHCPADADDCHDDNQPNRLVITGASITPPAAKARIVDAEHVGGDLCIPGTLDAAEVAGKVVLCRRGAIARAAKSLAVFQAGGVGMIMYNNSDVDNLYSDSHWVPSLHVDNTPGLRVKEYINDATYSFAKINTGKKHKWHEAPSMTIFSSRGPNPVSPDIIKPDITAPGHQILAGYSPFPDPGSTPPGELFAAIAGTSMSSPHIAGLFALIKQAHPDWTPAMAQSALMTTAHQDVVDNDRVSPADPFDFGAGHVDIGKPDKRGSAFQPGLVYDAGLFEYAAYTCGEEFGVFTPGSCDFLESIGVPSDPSDLNYPSIAVADLAGSQTVVRTVTSVVEDGKTKHFHAHVDAPPGYHVTVSPHEITLNPGDSATYEVTITSTGAPAGEWRFGSLVWHDAKERHEVRSPIAVKAALFDAADEVSATGTDGSVGFGVSFGYNGSYTAAPHGLSADAPISGAAGQDPDQTYPSGDDAPPGVQEYLFPITDSAFARWELVIPGPDDLDLFLEDSSGTIIASSTAGGTDELIELVLPADDTYTLVVHGWSVPNAPLPFTVHFWDVPLTSGTGPLVIDSAPASATIGVPGTVDVSWAGLAGGTRYLGAVSHTGDVGLMGLTLVNVDT